MLRETPSEMLGHLSGYLVGPLTGTISYLRQSRIFHPRGVVYRARVEALQDTPINFHPHALVRLSASIWKDREWKDTLGLAIRFSRFANFTETPAIDDQDLLLATFNSPWKVIISPLLTKQRDFLANEYFSVSPFILSNRQEMIFKISWPSPEPGRGKREEKLEEARREGRAWFLLQGKTKNGKWKRLAKLTLEQPLNLDQEALAFDPFLNGMGIRPKGFLQFMRIGAYRLSQLARPRNRDQLLAKESVLPSSPPYADPSV